MNGKFTTTVEDDSGCEHDVLVHYNFVEPRAATHWEPAEGGCEIEDVTSPIKLTKLQMDRITQECIDYAWDCWRDWDG